jgi:hypothetical protein
MSQEDVVVRGVRYPISLPSEKSARRRRLGERLFVRVPTLFRALADLLSRLPLRSRIRRRLRASVSSRALAAANRRDFAVLLLAMDPAIEYHPPVDQLPIGMYDVYHGRDGYERVWRELMDAFEDFRADPVDLIDLGDTLVATIDFNGHGSGSGVPIHMHLVQVYKLRRGLVVWQKDFSDHAEALDHASALESVGLSE